MRVEIRLGPHSSFTGVVGQPQTELPVDLSLVLRIGGDQDLADPAQVLDEPPDLVLGQP
ncbi:hypothetical protein ACWEKJ_10540 [Amycolatopsis thermoflava]